MTAKEKRNSQMDIREPTSVTSLRKNSPNREASSPNVDVSREGTNIQDIIEQVPFEIPKEKSNSDSMEKLMNVKIVKH